MLSKNNRKEQFRKQEPKKQRFAIKKLTVGVASVLIGFTFMGMSASADANNTPASSTQPASESSTDDDNNASPSTVPLKTPVAPTQGLNATPVSNQMAANTSVQEQIKENRAITPDQKEDSTVKTADKYADKVAKNYQNKLQVLASLGQTPADNTATTQEAQPKVLRGTQSQDVSDWQGFVNAMNNGNVGTINITGDIVVNNTANGTQPSGIIESNKNYLYLDSKGSAGTVDINGNSHKITFGNYSLALQAKNEKNIDKTWNLTFKDLTIDAASSSYAPISFYKTSSKDVLTYENVTANLANRPLVDNYSNGMTVNLNNVTTTVTNAANNVVTGNAVNVNGSTFTVDGGSNVINGTATVNFTGDNAITLTNMVMGGSNINTASANAVYSNKVNFNSGTTTFNVDGNIANKTGSAINTNNWMVRASSQGADTVVINQGATVNLNSKSANMRGIWAGRQTTTAAGQPSYGSLVVNGNLNANMANGHSTAIFAQNLEIGTGADVTIHTKQDNQADGTENSTNNQNTNSNSTHQAPITIFLGPNSSVATPVSAQEGHIINNGNLTVIRDNTNKTLVPLISFGQGLGKNMTLKFVNGEGSTLDLQDNSGTYLYGTEPSAPFSGLITMWGTSANDIIQFNDPKYINLQRTGETRGTLIRLEGVDNKTTIKGSTPVAQWDQGNKTATPNYTWYVDLVQTQNQWGNNSGTFLGKNQTPNHVVAHNGVQTLYNSNATVKMAANQGDQEYNKDHVNTTEAAMQLNSFLNNFNYWRPQRIAMGSKLTPSINDADKYQPEVQTINGTTTQTLNDLNAKDGIKDLIGPNNETIANFDNIISKVSWYNSATDQAEWNKLMIQPTESKNPADQTPYAQPKNPTGDLKTNDKSAWAKVTYKDGTVDFVNIPLNITEPMAGIYTPSYKPVTVEQGQSATDNPTFTDQSGKDTTAPTGTTFTTGTDTPAWATVDPSTGTVTVKPGTDVTPGAYNVPVTVTYPDKSTDETTVPVIVTKAGQTVTWGDNGAVVTTVDTSKLNAHETTENSQVLSPATVVTAEGYELTNGKLSTTATPITIDPSTVSWTITPDTNVTTATAAGKQIENNTIKIDLTNNDAANYILGSKNGVVTTNSFTIDAKGAGAKNVTTPVNVALGSDLTSEQFNQLVDNNIPTDEIATTTWATKPNEQGQGGVIKVTFTDKDVNGNPTYLNVNVPSSSIKITTDADDHNPEGQNVSTKVGETPDAEKGIKNPGSLPNGTTYTWQTTPKTTTPGKEPAVVVVNYPDSSKDTIPTNVIVNAKPEIKSITTTVGSNPAATEGIANLNNGGTTPVDGYPSAATWKTKPDTSKPGATTGTATVTYPDGTTETVTIPVAVNGQGDVTVIDNGHIFSLHVNNVVTHKTSDKNIIGEPVIENFKLSYYQGGQNYSKPYIYTLNDDKTAYVLTQTGDNPAGVTVNAPQSINVSDIKISWTEANTVLFNNALGTIMGNGQPTSLASENNGGTKTITYTNWVNNQFGYPKYSAVVNSSSVNWPIYGKGPVLTYPFPSVYIYGAEANGTIPSVNSDVTDLKAALVDASKLVNTNDLTADHNSKISSVNWQTLPSLAEANAKAPATVRINFTDGSYLDVPVAVNVIKVDQGVDDKANHDIYRDITRTINVEGESTPVIQHVIYSRAKITDLSKPAGQQISYTDWAATKNSEGQAVTNFPQYEVTKPGYTATATGATIETVDGKQYVPVSGTITEDSPNETVNVTYTTNEHTLVINYVDGDGTVVGTYNVPGKTNETVNVDVPEHVPANWKLVPSQQVIGSYKFGSDDPQPVDYKVEHGTEVVPVDKNNKDTYRKITQTIQEVPAGKTKADMIVVRTASVKFERTGVKDLVTGNISWNPWNSNSETFPVYNIKEQKGYDSYVNDVKATEVATVTVNPESRDITDTITYVKQSATPVPYDPSNKDMNMSVTRTINYEVPAGHEAISPVTQTVEYTRDVNGVAGYQDPVNGEITWNAWHVKSGKAEFISASVEQIKGYDSYVDGTKSTEVPAAAVTEKDGEPQNGANVTVSYQKQADTPVPYKPGQEGVNDDMNQYVTRTIVVHEPGQDPVSHDQTVRFTREGAQGNAGYTNPVTGKITWNAWHVAGELNQANGTWAEFNAPTVKGYTPSQAKVAAEEVTAETKNVTVDINYAPVAPTGQNVTTKVGEVPGANQGIANKGDLPDGTKYSWKTTPDVSPDVSTEGEKPAVVIVTYPGGSTVEVPVTVTVTKNSTDADKYTPESQDVNTKTGVVPDPADGIKNKADHLPDGTKYTWTNPDQVAQDVKKPGSYTETITVRYPDGSEDTVTVTVNVPAPEGQNITTDQGQLPNPADAIKNKDQMPNGTTYTWKQEPDVSTPGDHTGVVEVHFPDGTTYEVTINVHVDAINPDNGGNTNSGNGSIDHQNGTEINNGSVIENVTGQTQNSATNSTSHQPAKTLPQTGNDSSKFSALAGLSLATFVSLFGFAGHDKKRKADK